MYPTPEELDPKWQAKGRRNMNVLGIALAVCAVLGIALAVWSALGVAAWIDGGCHL